MAGTESKIGSAGAQLVRWAMPGFVSGGTLIFLIWAGEWGLPRIGRAQTAGGEGTGGTDAEASSDATGSIVGKLWDELGRTSDEGGIGILGGVVGAIALVTAVGYMLAMLHHLCLHFYPGRISPDLRRAIPEANIVIRDFNNDKIDPDELRPSGAWTVVNIAWHANKGATDSRVAAAEWRSQSMFDIIHGAGATFVGVVFATATAMLIAASYGLYWGQSLSAGVALSGLAFINYLVIAKKGEAVTGGLLIAVSSQFDQTEIGAHPSSPNTTKPPRADGEVAAPTAEQKAPPIDDQDSAPETACVIRVERNLVAYRGNRTK